MAVIYVYLVERLRVETVKPSLLRIACLRIIRLLQVMSWCRAMMSWYSYVVLLGLFLIFSPTSSLRRPADRPWPIQLETVVSQSEEGSVVSQSEEGSVVLPAKNLNSTSLVPDATSFLSKDFNRMSSQKPRRRTKRSATVPRDFITNAVTANSSTVFVTSPKLIALRAATRPRFTTVNPTVTSPAIDR